MPGLDFSVEEARRIGVALGVDWDDVAFDPDEYRAGIEYELEHAARGLREVSDDDELAAFRGALERLREHPDHYTRLERREAELRAYSESL